MSNSSDQQDIREMAEALAAQQSGFVKSEEMSPEKLEQLIHDLKVYQIELELQNEELRQSQEELSASRNEYFNLFHFSPVGYLVTDLDGTIRKANLAFIRLVKQELSDVLGKHLFRFVSMDCRSAFVSWLKRFERTGVASRLEIRLMEGDGPGPWVEIYPEKQATDEEQQEDNGSTRLHLSILNVTERRLVEDSLRDSEARLKRSQEIAHLGSWELDLATGSLLWSDEVYRIFGYSAQQFIPTYEAFLEAIHPLDRKAVDEAYSHSVANMLDGYEIEHRVIRADNGEITHVLEKCEHYRDTNGRITKSVGMVLDITEQKRTEMLLKARLDLVDFARSHTLAELLEKTLDIAENLTASSIGFYHFVEKDQQTLVLQAWSTRTKAEFCQAKGAGLHYNITEAGVWVDCVRERRPVIHNDYATLLHKKGLPEGHAPVIRELVVPILRGERLVAILGVGNKPTDYTGRDVETIAFLADVAWEITDRKRKGEELERSREQYMLAVNGSQDGIWDWDIRNNRLFLSSKWKEMIGYAADELPDEFSTFEELLHPDDRERVMGEIDRYLKGSNKHYSLEFRFRHRDGSYLWILARGEALRDEAGLPYRMAGSHTDVTGRRRMEEALRENEALFRSIFETANDGILVVEGQSRMFVMANTVVCNMLGYSRDELLQLSVPDIHPPEQIEKVLDIFERQYRGEFMLAEEMPMRRKDGSTFYADINASPMRLEGREFLVGILRDITERREAQEAMKLRDRVFTHALDMLCVAGFDGYFKVLNPAWSRTLGWDMEELLRRPYLDFVHPLDREATRNASATIVNGQAIYQFENRYICKDGSVRWLAWNSFPYQAEGIMFGVARDVTESKRAEEMLLQTNRELEEATVRAREMAVQAEAANIAKSHFLANMSHEIRTPMNAVIGMSDLLLETPLSEKQRQYLSVISKSADSLLGIINDILDYSKIEADRLDIEEIDFDLRTLLEDVSDLVAMRAHEKNLEFVCFMPPDVPTRLIGDPTRLRQIISNLANNGVKFTGSGEVSVRVTGKELDRQRVRLDFEVTDTGIGLSEEARVRLFQPFVQADSSTTRQFGGTGLGLSIAKRLVEMMGGKIGVDSEEGKGSRFWFTITLKKQRGRQWSAVPESPGDIRSTRILAVDDNATNRMVIGAMLENWGCRFSIAENGNSALAMLDDAIDKDDAYGLVVLDMAMPGMDGEELGRKIRARETYRDPAMVMLTSVGGGNADAARMRNIGFDAYLSKPIKQSHLYSCLSEVLANRNKPSVSSTAETQQEQACKPVCSMRVLLVEDNSFNQMVAREILLKLGLVVEVADNGRIAVEKLSKDCFDAVFMDVQMPELDGYEATAVIRNPNSSVLQHNVPIVAMTANAMKGDREACLEAGMDDYVAKPIKRDELVRAIERVRRMKKSDKVGVPATDEPGYPALPESTHLFDEAGLFERLGGDRALVQTILAAFVEDAVVQTRKLGELLNVPKLDEARRLAHSIKGSSGNAGARAMYQTALQIEDFLKAGSGERAAGLMAQLAEDCSRFEALLREKRIL